MKAQRTLKAKLIAPWRESGRKARIEDRGWRIAKARMASRLIFVRDRVPTAEVLSAAPGRIPAGCLETPVYSVSVVTRLGTVRLLKEKLETRYLVSYPFNGILGVVVGEDFAAFGDGDFAGGAGVFVVLHFPAAVEGVGVERVGAGAFIKEQGEGAGADHAEAGVLGFAEVVGGVNVFDEPDAAAVVGGRPEHFAGVVDLNGVGRFAKFIGMAEPVGHFGEGGEIGFSGFGRDGVGAAEVVEVPAGVEAVAGVAGVADEDGNATFGADLGGGPGGFDGDIGAGMIEGELEEFGAGGFVDEGEGLGGALGAAEILGGEVAEPFAQAVNAFGIIKGVEEIFFLDGDGVGGVEEGDGDEIGRERMGQLGEEFVAVAVADAEEFKDLPPDVAGGIQGLTGGGDDFVGAGFGIVLGEDAEEGHEAIGGGPGGRCGNNVVEAEEFDESFLAEDFDGVGLVVGDAVEKCGEGFDEGDEGFDVLGAEFGEGPADGFGIGDGNDGDVAEFLEAGGEVALGETVLDGFFEAIFAKAEHWYELSEIRAKGQYQSGWENTRIEDGGWRIATAWERKRDGVSVEGIGACDMKRKTSKHQGPSTREASNSNIQSDVARDASVSTKASADKSFHLKQTASIGEMLDGTLALTPALSPEERVKVNQSSSYPEALGKASWSLARGANRDEWEKGGKKVGKIPAGVGRDFRFCWGNGGRVGISRFFPGWTRSSVELGVRSAECGMGKGLPRSRGGDN
jgi:hypothetical protein